MLRPSFFVLFIILLSVASYSQAISDLAVDADQLSYSADGTVIEATGSVEAVNGDMTVFASDLVYNISSREIVAMGGFSMLLKNGLTVEGDSVVYNLATRKGSAKGVSMDFKRSFIRGSSAVLDEEKVELKDASFTTCDLEQPHYHISSSTTTLYPDDGWVIGYMGFLWLGPIPAVPVPIYMYDLSAQGLGGQRAIRDVLSMPEFGSNDEDGNYISYKVPWIANRKLNGRIHLLYTEKGGMAEGIDGDYLMNDNNDMYLRVFYDPRYDYYGGVTHTYSFGPRVGPRTSQLYNFFHVKDQLLFQLITDVSYRERVNYQVVSQLPNVTLKLNDIAALFPNFRIGGQVSYGRITEESSGIGSDRGILRTNGYFSFSTDLGSVYYGIGYNQTWYSFDSSWTRISRTASISRSFGYGFDGYMSHLHYISYVGNSPFLYEQYFEKPSDEFGIGLGYNFLSHRMTVDYSYYVPDMDPKDLDYGLSIGFHCFSVDLKYRTMRKEFIFGVSLIVG